MGLFNPADNSINLKLVYYGPAFGGKTTNLRQLQRRLDPGHEQAMVSVNTGQDTTLFFDYLPIRLLLLDRYQVRVQAYTVPGQVRFDTTRRLVLQGADGVIFVADSSRERARDNRISLQNLFRSLRGMGLKAHDAHDTRGAHELPIILQYNKRDLAFARSIEELEQDLNRGGRPHLVSSAISGEGVFESFSLLLGRMVERVHSEYDLQRHGLSLEEVRIALDRSLESAALQTNVRSVTGGDASGREVLHIRADLSGQETDVSGTALLEGALTATMELAELAGSLAESRSRLSARMERVLEQTERTVHDLRKPLVVLTNSMFLLSDAGVPGAGVPALEMATEVVGHMGELIDRCAASLKSGDQSPGPEQVVDLMDLAEGVLRRLSYVARERGVELILSSDLPRVRGRPEELTSLISNLVGNAIKYCHGGNTRRFVELTGRPVRRGFLLAVRDNGVGIRPEDRERIFKKYTRAGSQAEVTGSGLGLHIVREIVRAHGGRLGLRSRAGGGSLFYVLLPETRMVQASDGTCQFLGGGSVRTTSVFPPSRT